MEELMDTTTSSFSTRSNAKRAAEQMIGKGTAPGAKYWIEQRANGRFEIVWKTVAITNEAIPSAKAQPSQTNRGHTLEGETRPHPNPGASEIGAEISRTGRTAYDGVASSGPTSLARESSEPLPIAECTEVENRWPDGARVMVRKGRSWREAQVISRIDPVYWRAEYPGGGSGMYREADIRAYDAERDGVSAPRPGRVAVTEPKRPMRSKYGIDPELIAVGRLPDKPTVVTSATNSHYQKHFDRLFDLAKAGDWNAVRDYRVSGSNSYSKRLARYREDLLALHAASDAS
jgi:hypothetical protein